MGWLANVLIVIGMYFVGEKKWWAFLFSIAGEGIWTYHAYTIGMFDLAAVCALFCVIAAFNMRKWKANES